MTPQLTWPASKVAGAIARDEAHVWAWPLDPTPVDLTQHAALLDDAEQQRMQRFHFAADRARYAMAHAHMRRILAAYLGQPPASIAFRATPLGKPELVEQTSRPTLYFSLSHSKTVAALAIAHEGPVGVDVEDVRPIEREVAASHFSAAENAALHPLQGDAWLRGFYRCWTRKEAILKAEGIGLHRALDGFDVSISAEAALLGTREPFSHSWTLHDVSPALDVMGALATAHGPGRLSLFSFTN